MAIPFQPHFVLPISRHIMRFDAEEVYELRSADGSLELTDKDVEALASVCNENALRDY